jgi:hypothetical protein
MEDRYNCCRVLGHLVNDAVIAVEDFAETRIVILWNNPSDIRKRFEYRCCFDDLCGEVPRRCRRILGYVADYFFKISAGSIRPQDFYFSHCANRFFTSSWEVTRACRISSNPSSTLCMKRSCSMISSRDDSSGSCSITLIAFCFKLCISQQYFKDRGEGRGVW